MQVKKNIFKKFQAPWPLKQSGFSACGILSPLSVIEQLYQRLFSMSLTQRDLMRMMREQAQRSPFNTYGPDWDYILDMSEDDPLARLRKFLKNGGRVNAFSKESKSGSRPGLHMATLLGNTTATHFLLGKGADLHVRDSFNKTTALHIAGQSGNIDAAKILIDRGADINGTDEDGKAPIHVAALNGKTAMAKLLIDRKADILFCAKYEEPALYCAAESGKSDTVQFFIEAGAPFKPINTFNPPTPFGIACERQRASAFRIFVLINLTNSGVESLQFKVLDPSDVGSLPF
jgi:hypothetical protein